MSLRPRRDGAECGAGLVARAAALLDVPEVELFDLAHRRWFGHRPGGPALERVFVAYMFARQVPPWVRHYAREVLRAGTGVPGAAHLGPDRRPRRAPPGHGRLSVAVTAAIFAVLCLLILDTTYDPGTSAPIVRRDRPISCAGGGPGLKLFESLAYSMTGRTAPPC